MLFVLMAMLSGDPADPACGFKGRLIVSSELKSVPVYNLKGQLETSIAVRDHRLVPNLVVKDCFKKWYIVEIDGKILAVEKLDVIVEQEGLLCHSIGEQGEFGGSRGGSAQRDPSVTDPPIGNGAIDRPRCPSGPSR